MTKNGCKKVKNDSKATKNAKMPANIDSWLHFFRLKCHNSFSFLIENRGKAARHMPKKRLKTEFHQNLSSKIKINQFFFLQQFLSTVIFVYFYPAIFINQQKCPTTEPQSLDHITLWHAFSLSAGVILPMVWEIHTSQKLCLTNYSTTIITQIFWVLWANFCIP